MSEGDAVHAAAGAEAHWIMQKADSLCPDGTVSLLEMCTFIKDSEHEGFLEWLLQDRYHPGGKFEYHEEFHKANTNHDSKLDMKELTAAVESWMKLGSPGLSVPRRVEVKEAEMTDKERELIAFRVPGIPDVVLPPPPQKKRSIYEKSYPQSTGYKPTMDSGTMRTGFNSTAFEASRKIGLRGNTSEGPLLLSSDDVGKSALGQSWKSAQKGQPMTMSEWFEVFGKPKTKDFETLSSRSEMQGKEGFPKSY